MAVVPTSGSNVRILSGIPWNRDYAHTRYFDTQSQQTSYMLGRNVVEQMDEANIVRIEGRHYIQVKGQVDKYWNANYLMFQNAEFNNKWFYAFITKIEYIQKNLTRIYFDIDIFQTWHFDVSWKPSFVIREHRPLWNADGSPVINTVDEGLDYGTIMETVSIENYVPFNDVFFLVIVTKNVMHEDSSLKGKITPVLNGSPQPLSFYVHPFKMDGTSPNVSFGGAGISLSNIDKVLNALYADEDAVNNIVSLYVTEHVGMNMSYDGTTLGVDSGKLGAVTVTQVENPSDPDDIFTTLFLLEHSNYQTSVGDFGDKYAGYHSVTESKLLMHPYTSLIIDDLKGNRAEFKNEFINNVNLLLTVRGSLGTSNKVAYSIANYGNRALGSAQERLWATVESAMINSNPNDVPVITDMLSAYLQGNRNSLEVQKSSIQFNGAMNALGGVANTVGSAMQGDIGGALGSGLGVVQGAGNAVLEIQGMEAKQKDISNIPPNIAKQGSNSYFDFGNQIKGVYVIKKQITPEYRKKLEDFFKLYGYKTNEVKIPNFHTRQNWNYVQTNSCNVTGNINNNDLEAYKSIFNNGITLWHTNDVQNYSLSNGVI